MKKVVFGIQIAANIAAVFAAGLLGLEAHGHMDPDKITIEAIIIGICLAINIICAFYKLYTDKR